MADLLLLTPRGFGVFQELHSWSCCLPKGLQPQAEVAQEQVGKHSCRLSTCLRCPYISGTESARLQPHTRVFTVRKPALDPSQLPPEPAHAFPSLPRPVCGTAALGEHKEIHMGFWELGEYLVLCRICEAWHHLSKDYLHLDT